MGVLKTVASGCIFCYYRYLKLQGVPNLQVLHLHFATENPGRHSLSQPTCKAFKRQVETVPSKWGPLIPIHAQVQADEPVQEASIGEIG